MHSTPTETLKLALTLATHSKQHPRPLWCTTSDSERLSGRCRQHLSRVTGRAWRPQVQSIGVEPAAIAVGDPVPVEHDHVRKLLADPLDGAVVRALPIPRHWVGQQHYSLAS